MQHFIQLTYSLVDMVPMAQEFYLFCFFCLGFVLFRCEALQRRLRLSASLKGAPSGELQQWCSVEQLRHDFKLQNYDRVLASWPLLEKYTIDALNIVVTVMVAVGRTDNIGVFISKAVANLPQLRSSLHETISAVITSPSEVQRQHVALALQSIFDQVRNDLDSRAIEVLATAFARFNDESRVGALIHQLTQLGQPVSSDTLCKIVWGFLHCKNLDASLGYLQRVLTAMGHGVPADLVVAIVKCATETIDSCGGVTCGGQQPQAWDVFDLLEGVNGVPVEGLVLLLDWAARRNPPDIGLAVRIEQKLLDSKGADSTVLPFGAYDALVRVHASSAGDQAKARSYFDELVLTASSGRGPSEGSLVRMISSCVDARNADLAERILHWTRKNKRCTLAVFSSVVKVLAASNRSDKICTQYEALVPEGLEPDDTMYGQLIKHAVHAGKHDLARELFQRSGNPDVQNVMSLIRACGQEGDVEQALNLLWDLRDRGLADTSTYNCTLDVCVSCKDHYAARSIFEAMQSSGKVDVVSYNILLKQYVGEGGNLRSAEVLLEEMRRRGLKPNISTYNSLLGGALVARDFRRAWRIVDMMEGPGPGVDAYTISILFKGYKREHQVMDARSFDRTLALIHSYNVKVDEVLVNVALEACVSLRDENRLKSAFETFKRSGWTMPKQCTLHTYGILIKAYGQTHQLDMAWKLWWEATRDKGLVPTEQLFGQMIDVLVTNDRFEDALALFEEMKATYGDHMESKGLQVAYAMIIKGYAQRKECAQAMRCYEEIQMHKVKVGLVVFNTVIDACSRVGDMDNAARLFRDMMDAQCAPDLITYSTLIKGYCVREELDEAIKLFSLMRRKGIKPDAVVFNSLLDGCAKKQMPDLCEQVISDMEEAGVLPSNYSASILIKSYGRCNDLKSAFKVLDEMPKKYGFRPNTAVYTCLMSTCIANGRFDLAMDLRTRMIEMRCHLDEKTYSTLLRGALRAGSVDHCTLLAHAALDQGNRGLLDEDLVKSVLLLIRSRHLWEQQGRHLLDRLREVGHPVQCCPEPHMQKAGFRQSRRRQSFAGRAAKA